MNSPEFLGTAFLTLQYSLVGSPEFPGVFRHFPGEGLWGPQITFWGEDEVDMLGSGEQSRGIKKDKLEGINGAKFAVFR